MNTNKTNNRTKKNWDTFAIIVTILTGNHRNRRGHPDFN